MTTQKKQRYISFSAPATKNISKHLADIFAITDQIQNDSNATFDKVIIEYDSDDNIFTFELTFSASKNEECYGVVEKLCNCISEYTVDVAIPYLQIHEVVYA